MPAHDNLTERELQVLGAVVQTYIETAEPAGSQTIARRSGLGVSSATIRNTMSDLEEKGYLFHPHTSAGRIPTDRGYRAFVDGLMRVTPPSRDEQRVLRTELAEGAPGAIEAVLRRAAQVLGVLTQELGVAAAPALDAVVLERLDLVPLASDRLLLVFNLRSGVVRTIFVQVPAPTMAAAAMQNVVGILNERLGGQTLREIRATLPERLRDAGAGADRELLNIFVAQGEDLFDLEDGENAVLLSSSRPLAEQPEFASHERMRTLLELTDRRDLLREALARRRAQGLAVTIGVEHGDARLAPFTLVTASYQAGDLRGVIGVMGPTRMPYEKVVSLVEHTSQLVEGLLS